MSITQSLARFLFVAVLSSSCGAADYTVYSPEELIIESKSTTFAIAHNSMQKLGLFVVESNLTLGTISTEWTPVATRQYNIQVLISPVGAAVKVGCRTIHSMNIQECSAATPVPIHLAKQATVISADIATTTKTARATANYPH